jgi:hypothetical protein
MDGSDGIGVYGEAKAEYTRQLCSFLVPALETYFLDLLAETKTTEKDSKRLLWAFQDALKQFPDWNIDKVQRETEKVQSETKCDYLEEILTAVFIAHTKVLSAIRLTSKQKKLQITIPKIDHFLHRTMSECARLLWSNAYLFAESGTSIERQKNLRQVGQLLHEGVLQSIRGMLPVKSILKEYLADDAEDTPVSSAQGNDQDEQEAEAEADIPPVVREETTETAPVEEEVKEKEEPVAPPPSPTTAHEEVKDLSGSAVPEAPLTQAPVAQVPTIVVETEPPSVGFTHMDAVLDTENPEQTTIRVSNQMGDDDDDDDQVNSIEIDTSVPPEPLDEFEDLGDEPESLVVADDEFETL